MRPYTNPGRVHTYNTNETAKHSTAETFNLSSTGNGDKITIGNAIQGKIKSVLFGEKHREPLYELGVLYLPQGKLRKK